MKMEESELLKPTAALSSFCVDNDSTERSFRIHVMY